MGVWGYGRVGVAVWVCWLANPSRHTCSLSHAAHTGAVNALASLAAGGNRGYVTLSGAEDCCIKLWAPPMWLRHGAGNEAVPPAAAAATGEVLVRPVRTLRGHTAGVTCLALLAAGQEHGVTCSAASVSGGHNSDGMGGSPCTSGLAPGDRMGDISPHLTVH